MYACRTAKSREIYSCYLLAADLKGNHLIYPSDPDNNNKHNNSRLVYIYTQNIVSRQHCVHERPFVCSIKGQISQIIAFTLFLHSLILRLL